MRSTSGYHWTRKIGHQSLAFGMVWKWGVPQNPMVLLIDFSIKIPISGDIFCKRTIFESIQSWGRSFWTMPKYDQLMSAFNDVQKDHPCLGWTSRFPRKWFWMFQECSVVNLQLSTMDTPIYMGFYMVYPLVNVEHITNWKDSPCY